MPDKPKVLYIDNEEINCCIFKNALEKKFEVFTSLDGESGLEILHEQPEIEYIMSDMRIPVMNGPEFVEKAKSEFPEKVYSILSGYSINDEIQELLILNYFIKPADLDAVGEDIECSLGVGDYTTHKQIFLR